MSIIRPLKPQQERHVCPDCRAPEGLIVASEGKITCRLCGWEDPEKIGAVYSIPTDEGISESVIKPLSPIGNFPTSVIKPLSSEKEVTDIRDLRQFRVTTYAVRNASTITVWGGAAYDSGLAYVKRRMWDEAIKAFQRAIDMDHDFVEAHLWLGRLLQDEKKQRDHLSYAIGYMNQSAEPLLEIMYLDGRITLSQLENALYGGKDIQQIVAPAPVESETVILSCPVCGGHMTTHPVTGHVECAYCGHIEDEAPQQSHGGESLTTALLQQQAEGVKWIIGERMIHCKNCGSKRTIPNKKMGSYCMYCGSQHIIVQDALNSFRQPDSIIPFSITQEQADNAIQARLFQRWERFKGNFINNKVKQATLTGIYLPFWVFDVTVDVNLTYKQDAEAYSQSNRKESHAESFWNYAFPAVLSPAPRLIEKINGYDLSKRQVYETSALARYPAEIYQVDFDKASLEVRGRIRQVVTKKYKNRPTSYRGGDLVNIWSTMRQMEFQLVLLPVWVATLIEDDDDIRIGLVNGQTGDAVLGKARKPDKYRI